MSPGVGGDDRHGVALRRSLELPRFRGLLCPRKGLSVHESGATPHPLSYGRRARTLRLNLGDQDWPVTALALNTGLRRAELFGLEWEHADFNINVLTIPR